MLEMAYAAADIFPVEVRPRPMEEVEDVHHFREFVPRSEDAQAALSKALKLQAPAVSASPKCWRTTML